MNITNTTEQKSPAPMFRKTIGQTTYLVSVHFSQTTNLTFNEKIKRLMKKEVNRVI